MLLSGSRNVDNMPSASNIITESAAGSLAALCALATPLRLGDAAAAAQGRACSRFVSFASYLTLQTLQLLPQCLNLFVRHLLLAIVSVPQACHTEGPQAPAATAAQSQQEACKETDWALPWVG